jgi:hypothetical protein
MSSCMPARPISLLSRGSPLEAQREQYRTKYNGEINALFCPRTVRHATKQVLFPSQTRCFQDSHVIKSTN